MFYIILMLNLYPVLTLPAREEFIRDEVTLVALPRTTAQERDLQCMGRGRLVEWEEVGVPKIVPTRVEGSVRWNIKFATGALGVCCRHAGDTR